MRCEHCGAQARSVGDLSLDVDNREPTRRGTVIPLTQIEFDVMQAFVENPGQVLSASQIYERAWGYDFTGESNRLGAVLVQLRRKLGEPRVLHTVRGVGFKLKAAS